MIEIAAFTGAFLGFVLGVVACRFDFIELPQTRNLIDYAIQHDIERMHEIGELQRQVAVLRSDAKLAENIIAKYVSPDVQSAAWKWLKEEMQ